jgi:hypothetical protein
VPQLRHRRLVAVAGDVRSPDPLRARQRGRKGVPGAYQPAWKPIRNGLDFGGYVWRGQPRPEFALQAIADAEAEHGLPPDDPEEN